MMKKDFFKLTAFTSKYFKFIITFTLSFCALCLFIFVITYMRVNEFFSFELLSFDNLWLFLFAFVYLLVFAFLALPFNLVAHYIFYKKKKNDFLFLSSLSSALIVFLSFLWVLNEKFDEINLHWLAFCGFIACIYLLFIGACLCFYERQNFKNFFIAVFAGLVLLVYMAILFPHHFETGFKRFLKTKGLSAKKVEIYLKDKQKFVIGELVFRDSKFAYVRFKDTLQGLNDEKNISKIVAIENISIIKDE
ncbi:hypothetical protein CVU14713_00835 [Campylobacter vulpis]|uniref:Uncharacterized protein n=2 Tax=Campylobacter vulpis TaxID=1655500 RepID=A0A2G4R2D6_9BACT|nr:hypothetical protein [Campylobacter vulpis]MBS4234916.1 hypothetical protein [Campylobacter vulpis]MBS4240624.1 hypothetical protein [Campylobacter vulpis]MBS4252091.1 hypothetical protein [Campylobacter vulpis]MBS4268526.1 hypothetical protein [Campylobacter vulpis]MBS4275003.1 hypothetical protein [Campylobacter vulpis]